MNALEDEGRVCRVERCARLREFNAHGTAPGSQNVWKHIETACRFESKAPPEAESEQVGSEFHFKRARLPSRRKRFWVSEGFTATEQKHGQLSLKSASVVSVQSPGSICNTCSEPVIFAAPVRGRLWCLDTKVARIESFSHGQRYRPIEQLAHRRL